MIKQFTAFAMLVISPVSFTGISHAKQILPRDNCLHLNGYLELRYTLETAVRNKDHKILSALIDDDIELDFGGSVGKQDFIERWKLSGDGKSPIWTELGKMLRLGCGFQKDTFTFPYFFTVDPGEKFDGYNAGLAVGTKINLRKTPSVQSEIIGQLNWDLVELLTVTENQKWWRIKNASGQIGYVSSEYIRSQIDYRAGFSKKNGDWKMMFFIAGD